MVYIYLFLIVALLFRPHKGSLFFVAGAILFEFFCSEIGGKLYFSLAIFTDFIIAGLLYLFTSCRKSLNLMALTIGSMVLNILGYVRWNLYLSSDMYVILFVFLYVVAFIAILKEDDPGEGSLRVRRTHPWSNSDVDSGARLVYKNEETL